MEKSKRTAQESSYCFEEACLLFDPAFERIQVTYEDTFLPGYFFKPDNSDSPKPTIIAVTGHDGTAEELYFYIAAAAIERGYNVLAFDGPGQGLALRNNNLTFRHDFESVITPVVDYLLQRNDVDEEHIAIAGYSMGGYFAPRAAAYDHRISACVANSGIYNFFNGVLGEKANSPIFLNMLKEENASQFNAHVNKMINNNISAWWKIKNGLFTFSLETPQQLINSYRKFTLEECVDKISCPVLICDSEEEHFLGNQAQILYDKLESPKKLELFNKLEGAALHCQCGAELLSSGRILDWLDDIFKMNK